MCRGGRNRTPLNWPRPFKLKTIAFHSVLGCIVTPGPADSDKPDTASYMTELVSGTRTVGGVVTELSAVLNGKPGNASTNVWHTTHAVAHSSNTMLTE